MLIAEDEGSGNGAQRLLVESVWLRKRLLPVEAHLTESPGNY